MPSSAFAEGLLPCILNEPRSPVLDGRRIGKHLTPSACAGQAPEPDRSHDGHGTDGVHRRPCSSPPDTPSCDERIQGASRRAQHRRAPRRRRRASRDLIGRASHHHAVHACINKRLRLIEGGDLSIDQHHRVGKVLLEPEGSLANKRRNLSILLRRQPLSQAEHV